MATRPSDAQATPRMTFATLLQQYASAQGFSGVVLIRRGDATVFEGAIGLAERAFNVPNTVETKFEIASISKSFVAVAALQLASRGNLILDQKVSAYLPELKTTSTPWADQVTVRQLLDHTSGLPREHDFSPWERLSSVEEVRRVARLALVSAPGARTSYSNAGYVLLASVIERVAGQPYAQYLREHVLEPSALSKSGFFIGRDVVPGTAVGYRPGRRGIESTWRARHAGVYAPGGMYASAGDLVRFAASLETGVLLRREMVDSMFALRDSAGASAGVGPLGFQLRMLNGRTYRFASGSADGSKSVIMREPTSKLTIVILANTGDAPVLDMLRDFLALVEGRKVSPPKACTPPMSTSWRTRLGDYDFSSTPLAKVLADSSLTLSLIDIGGHPFLGDAKEDEAQRLCADRDGWLRLAFTAQLRVQVESGVD
ncbi:MAG: beta-lactamase family protein, partial [Gemmatimonadaceae bacterium]|nr:beta-lactamase family protein [Gemmatimonadaceae bacterium]